MAAEGDVLYEIRGDDSKLESDLDAAQKKVEQSSKKSGERQEAIEENTSKNLKTEKESVADYHEKQNDRVVKDDEDTGKKREENEKKTSDKLKSIASGTAAAIGAGMAAAAGVAVAAAGSAVNSAVDMDQAMNQFIASTGLAKEGTDYWRDSLEQIYADNYGEDFADIAEAMATVKKEVGAFDSAELTSLVESGFTLRDVFGYDIPESARAAKAMMDSFGVSGEEAMNLIAAGAQNGLDYSGELIDSISEYSVQFAKVGLSAADMFNIFQTGAETGAWNLDKIGDAVKELAIRVVDGSDTTAEGFELIGLNAEEMAAKFAAGGESAREAFYQTVEALSALEDPLAQNTAGVNLFGTMWEDLGPEVVTQLASIQDGIYATGEEMENLKEVKYDDLGSMFEELKRNVELLILPLGEQLIPLLSELIESVLPLLEEALPPIIDVFGQLIEQLAPAVENILPVLLDLLSSLAPPLLDIVESILPIFVELFNELLPPLLDIVEKILPVLVELMETIMPLFESLMELLEPILELILELLEPLLELLEVVLMPLVELLTLLVEEQLSQVTQALELLTKAIKMLVEKQLQQAIKAFRNLKDVFNEVFTMIQQIVKINIDAVRRIFEDIVDFVKNVFTGNWKAAWETVRDIFKAIADSLAETFKIPINWIIDKINSFIDGLNRIQIPSWVPGLGGLGFNIPHIPKLRIGMDFVPEDDFPALLHRGEAVLTAEENSALQQIGGMGAVYSLLNAPVREPQEMMMWPDVAAASEIDYERLGTAVADALVEGNVRFIVDGREFARLEREYGL